MTPKTARRCTTVAFCLFLPHIGQAIEPAPRVTELLANVHKFLNSPNNIQSSRADLKQYLQSTCAFPVGKGISEMVSATASLQDFMRVHCISAELLARAELLDEKIQELSKRTIILPAAVPADLAVRSQMWSPDPVYAAGTSPVRLLTELLLVRRALALCLTSLNDIVSKSSNGQLPANMTSLPLLIASFDSSLRIQQLTTFAQSLRCFNNNQVCAATQTYIFQQVKALFAAERSRIASLDDTLSTTDSSTRYANRVLFEARGIVALDRGFQVFYGWNIDQLLSAIVSLQKDGTPNDRSLARYVDALSRATLLEPDVSSSGKLRFALALVELQELRRTRTLLAGYEVPPPMPLWDRIKYEIDSTPGGHQVYAEAQQELADLLNTITRDLVAGDKVPQ